MSYDLTIWKWAADARATPDEIFEAIGQDEAHPAMQRFDVKAFLTSVYANFGGEELWSDETKETPFQFEVADFTGTPANWIGIHIAYSRIEEVASKLLRL